MRSRKRAASPASYDASDSDEEPLPPGRRPRGGARARTARHTSPSAGAGGAEAGPEAEAPPRRGPMPNPRAAAHFCAECKVEVGLRKWHAAKQDAEAACYDHKHVCVGGWGGKTAAGCADKLPPCACALNKEWLLSAADHHFDSFLRARPTLKRLWEAQCAAALTPALQAELTKDLRKGQKFHTAREILRERKDAAEERCCKGRGGGAAMSTGSPSSDSDDSDDSAGGGDAAETRAAPAPAPGPPAGDVRGPEAAAPAPAVGRGAPLPMIAGTAGRRSNVAAQVVAEPEGRFGDIALVEAALQTTSVVLLTGTAGVGKTCLGLRLAQRRARREATWGDDEAADGAAADALGPFRVSLSGCDTPEAASLCVLKALAFCAAVPKDVTCGLAEEDAPEALCAALGAALPDAADAARSACLFVLDHCDQLFGRRGNTIAATAALAWGVRLAGVAAGVRVVMLARSALLPGSEKRATLLTVPPLPADVVAGWLTRAFEEGSAAQPGLHRSGLLRPPSDDVAARLTLACGGLPAVIEPLVDLLRAGMLGTPEALLRKLRSDAPDPAALMKELDVRYSVPRDRLALPHEAQEHAAKIEALAALAEPDVSGGGSGAFSRADAQAALGYASMEEADEVVTQLLYLRVLTELSPAEVRAAEPVRLLSAEEDDDADEEAAAKQRRVFRMCGLRVTLARGSAAWAEARLRLTMRDVAADAAARAAAEVLPAACSPSLFSQEFQAYEALDQLLEDGDLLPSFDGVDAHIDPRPLAALGEDSNPAATATAAAQLVSAEGLAAVVAAPPPRAAAQPRVSRRGAVASPQSGSMSAFAGASSALRALSPLPGESEGGALRDLDCGRTLRSGSKQPAA